MEKDEMYIKKEEQLRNFGKVIKEASTDITGFKQGFLEGSLSAIEAMSRHEKKETS